MFCDHQRIVANQELDGAFDSFLLSWSSIKTNTYVFSSASSNHLTKKIIIHNFLFSYLFVFGTSSWYLNSLFLFLQIHLKS